MNSRCIIIIQVGTAKMKLNFGRDIILCCKLCASVEEQCSSKFSCMRCALYIYCYLYIIIYTTSDIHRGVVEYGREYIHIYIFEQLEWHLL